MERKIVEVKEANKSAKSKEKKKINLKQVAKVVSENKETIAAVATAVGTLMNSNNSKKTSKKTSTAKRKTTSSKKKNTKSNDMVSTLVDMFLK